jgi:hypothetical protein
MQAQIYPFATLLSLVSIPVGLLALCVGPEVSTAFTRVFGRPEPVYLWGVVLLLGGAHVAYGLGWHVPSRERAGLWVLAGAWSFYGACVILGLGLGGLVTGPLSLTLAAAALLRARVILRTAQTITAVDRVADVAIVSDVHSGVIVAAPPDE